MGSKKDSRKPQGKGSLATTNGDDVRKALGWILIDAIFTHLQLHGNVKWSPLALVRLAIFWVWSPESSLVEAAKKAIAQVTKMFGEVAVRSYQALMGALRTYTAQLLPVLWARLQGLMEECGEAGWRVGRWLPLAVDGSRVGVPRTRKNEDRFCKPTLRDRKKARRKKRGRHASSRHREAKRRFKKRFDRQPVSPQLWLTLIWHIGLRLPWCWKLGPSYSSEREHLQTMLNEQSFPKNTLFCGDAGFVGYDFWRAIMDKRFHFLMRVGSNVHLLRKLGKVRQRNDIVYCWPRHVMEKKQPPLMVRLLRFHDGRSEVFLVTSVLNDKELSVKQAGVIYRKRWGIELQFRALKQTYGRTKLRSRTPDNADIEMHWSLLGLAMVQLLALKERSQMDEPTDRTSIATVLRVVRSMIADQAEIRQTAESLRRRLQRATTDSYKRRSKKQSRNYPRRKEEPSAGKPCIKLATAQQRAKLRDLTAFTPAA